jgi:hypothetical protein
MTNKKILEVETNKVHPWRICPLGKHFVKTYVKKIPPSITNPNGTSVKIGEHCAENPSKKDLLSFDEIIKISENHFSSLVGSPKAGVLKFDHADHYDSLIRGWTRYWNDIFQPADLLDPNLVKALIASESGFNVTTDNKINTLKVHAYGLMQLREETLKILQDHKGELKDHLIHLTHENAYDASANICAGIRWLFRKKEIITAKMGSAATWDKAVAAYKSYLGDKNEDKEMKNFHDNYKLLLEG